MKILMINVVCGIRSTGRICTDLATALEKQGHEVKIAYGRGNVPDPYQKYAVRIGNKMDVCLHGIRARLFDGAGFGSRRATMRFIEWVKKYDPDVIHLHNLHGYYINIGVLFHYLKTCAKKILWTLHDCWAFTGHSAFCDAVHCERWKTGCHHCPQKNEYPQTLIERSNLNWNMKRRLFASVPAMTLIVPSEWLAELVKKSFMKKYELVMIHNGVDTSQFYPLENDFKIVYHMEGKFIILGISHTWDKQNGYYDFIKLSSMLKNTVRIVLVGVSEEQKKALPENIIGVSWTESRKERIQIYEKADVLVHLAYSKQKTGLIMEAVRSGLPLIAYHMDESVYDGNNSYIVEQGDLESVSDRIRKLQDARNSAVETDLKTSDCASVMDGYFQLRNKYGFIGKKIILGVAAVWDHRKGLDDFIQLSHLLSVKYKIILVGLKESQQKRLPENIIGISKTDNVDDLRKLYALADVFVNPTLEDNYPTTNLEAIACGTPVITYYTGGSAESAVLYGGVCTIKTAAALQKELYKNIWEPEQDVLQKISVVAFAEQYVNLYTVQDTL